MNYKIIFFLFLIFLSSCYNYETQFDGPYNTAGDPEQPQQTNTLIRTAAGKFYLSNDFGFETIESNDSLVIQMASINNNHTKVLFKEDGQEIQVFDITTQTIDRSIEGSQFAVFFDYHPNNESIYHLDQNGILYIDGPQIYDTNPLNMDDMLDYSSPFNHFETAVILPNNDIIAYYGSSASNSIKYIVKLNESGIIKDLQVQNDMVHMRINHNGTLLNGSEKYSWGHQSYEIDINSLELSLKNRAISLPHSYLAENIGYYIDDDHKLNIPEGESFYVGGTYYLSLDY